jgi:glycerophosphoryl diester phosphodiesterase
MAKTLTWKPVWDRRWQLLFCALLFQTVESLFFAPLLGLVGHALLGRPVVDSTGLVSFVLSPRGFLLLFLAAAILLTIRLLEQAGLAVIVLGALQGKAIRGLTALRFTLPELPRLMSIGAFAIGWGLLVAAPLLTVTGFFASGLLAKHDINFYLASWPPEFITAAVVIGVVAVAMLVAGGWLFVRWRLVVQVCIFDKLHGRAAFRESAELTRGVWWPLASRCVGVLGFELALAFAAAGLGQVAVRLILSVSSVETFSLGVSLGLMLLLRTVTSAVVISIGGCVSAGVFTLFYQKRRQALRGDPELPTLDALATTSAPAGRLVQVAALMIGLCVSEIFGVFVIVDAFKQERAVTVTAHRGGHLKAPENTAASIREAIAVGAQYAEIDVQLTKDGVVVVTHDSDFSRMGGVARKVWDLTYNEIRAIPLGARSAPQFRNEPAPTFDEVLDIARDHIKLNVELKYYGDHEPRLAERVIKEVYAHRMTNEVIIQCLEYRPLQEVRRLAPQIPVGYLLSVNARQPSRLKVNFLGAALSRATGAFVLAAHRRGQQVHVWTVNKTESMERMIDISVDDLITDRPAEALRLVHEYEGLSSAERRLRGIRACVAN